MFAGFAVYTPSTSPTLALQIYTCFPCPFPFLLTPLNTDSFGMVSSLYVMADFNLPVYAASEPKPSSSPRNIWNASPWIRCHRR